MSYRSRERKRRQRIAQGRAQADARRSGSSAERYWLTVTRQTTCCARCGYVLRPGREVVYRHRPLEVLCVPCADREQVPYRPSLRWERDRAGGRAA
jgi:hypothetical protein